MKLFAVYLGGRAPKANTELHDVVFAVGETVEATYPQLLEKWFGEPRGLHLDSWLELDVVDGWRISLSDSPSSQPEKLFFVNLGAYDDSFTELHASGFFVAASAAEAKSRALATLLRSAQTVHKDDLHQVDDCIALDRVNEFCITLTRTGETSSAKPNNGYHVIPKDVIAAWLARR
jgi:hypothetical protein